MKNRASTFRNYGLTSVSVHTFLLLKWEVMEVNRRFFYHPTEEDADQLFKLLERWRTRRKA